MSQENVEIVRRMYEAFHGGDADGALAYFDPEVEVDASVRVDEGIGHGRDAVNAMVARWLAAWDEWREEIEEIRDLDSRVLVISKQRGRAKGSGIEVETRYAVLYEIQDDLITAMTLYATAAEALEAAGLREG
jgi:ketosteroid isomerase-like protein